MSGKFLDDRGFHCFPTIPDFAEMSGNCQTSVPDLRYSSVTDAIFMPQVEVGNWSEAI